MRILNLNLNYENLLFSSAKVQKIYHATKLFGEKMTKWNKSYQFICKNCMFFVSGNYELHNRKVKHDNIACKDYDE